MKLERFKYLETKYGSWGSWAVWGDDVSDLSLFYSNEVLGDLHAKTIIVGLNMSKPLENKVWANFHLKRRGGHDRKLKDMFNHHPKVRGAYMTDLIKQQAEDSKEIIKILESPDVLNHKNFFFQEMADIGATQNTVFILLGEEVRKIFALFTDGQFPKVIPFRHHSARGSDQMWKNEAYLSLEGYFNTPQ